MENAKKLKRADRNEKIEVVIKVDIDLYSTPEEILEIATPHNQKDIQEVLTYEMEAALKFIKNEKNLGARDRQWKF